LDLADFAILQAWFTGPDPAMTPECGPMNLDLDQDVDAADYAAFMEHFTG